jgi:hypothetical protein
MPKEKEVDLFDELKKELDRPEAEEPKEEPKEPEKPKEEPKEEPKPEPKAEEAAPAPEPPKEPEPSPQSKDFKSVKEFLAAVEDKPSRNLLEKFYGVIKNETSAILAPIEKANANAKFDEEFGKYEKLEGLADHKNDLRKTFLRNPNQSLKALIGETVADLQLSKIKPLETTPSSPKRGEVDTSNLSKDELYDMLEAGRE